MTANFAGHGGAIWCEAGSSPVITECQFTENSGDFGGAAYFMESAATIRRCVFRHNFTTDHSAGTVRSYQSNLTISDCPFVDNSSGTYGGAIFCSNQSKLTLDNCSFIGNYVLCAEPYKSHGGAIICESTTITNCLFAGNSALVGGALLGGGTWLSSIILSNCTFAGNYAPQGNTLYVGGGVYGSPMIQVRNCVVIP